MRLAEKPIAPASPRSGRAGHDRANDTEGVMIKSSTAPAALVTRACYLGLTHSLCAVAGRTQTVSQYSTSSRIASLNCW